jgi:hypothetical protein
MQYKIAQLSLTPGRNAKNTTEVYIAQPDANKEALAGKLFMLVETPKKGTGGLKLVNFLIDNLNFNYYQNEKILLREKLPSLRIEHIFEMALTKTNKNLNSFLEKEEIGIPLENINITAGVIHEGKIYFTVGGKNKAFLAHKRKNSDEGGEEYKLTDLTQGSGSTKDKKSKLFTDVLNGIIPPSGHFLFTNEALPEYVSAKQLIAILSTLPPAGAVEQVKNILTGINAYISFMAVVIRGPSSDRSDEPRIVLSTRDSISSLNRTEESTEELLMPSGVINLKKWLKAPAAAKELVADKLPTTANGGFTIKDKIFFKKKTFRLFGRVGSVCKNIFAVVSNILLFAAKPFSNRQKIIDGIKNFFLGIGSAPMGLVRFMAQMSIKNKVLLSLAAVFVLLFFSNVFLAKNKQTKADQERQYEELVQEIEKRQDQAEAHMLYSNEEGATKLFEEIGKILQDLPQETDEQRETYKQFEEKYNSQMEKIRRVEKVETELLADFKNLIGQAEPVALSFVKNSNKLYAADTSQRSIYILDTSNNLATTVADLESDIDNLSISSVSKNFIYYLNKDKVMGFDLGKEELTRLNINTVVDHAGFRAADVYNERLYLLNADKNQIYRFNRAGSSFSSPYAWVGDKLDLSGAVDLSIDGNIFVLNSGGEILKLLHGSKVDFRLDQIDPKIEEAAKLFVSPENDHIYVLEPKHRRLIVYNKKGQFLLQYANSDLDDLRDFAVNEKDKVIYVLNGSSVLSFKASHLD